MAPARQLEILLIDDSPADVRMTQLALETAGIPNRLHVVETGEKGLMFLLQDGEYAAAPRPDVVLLDLKLPKASGFSVLSAVRSHRRMKDLVVVVFTGSSLQRDEAQSYRSNANLFMTKPAGLEAYVAAMRRIHALIEPSAR